MRQFFLHAACAALLVVLSGAIPGCGGDGQPSAPADAEGGDWPPAAFQGPSTGLKRTVVVPTLDTPMPPGKNVIWCASFQVAWNKLKDDLAKGPVELDRAQEMADRLNRAEVTEADLPEGSYYAAAGWVKDGIVNTIESEMQERFGRSPKIRFEPSAADGCTAYAYLQARVKFGIPFFENGEPFSFQDSGGAEVPVSSFGIRAKDFDAYYELRKQVEVLYAERPTGSDEAPQFVIDPCKTSQPNQLVLACTRPGKTLAETLDQVRRMIDSFGGEAYRHEFGSCDRLIVPNTRWEIEHELAELKGARFQKPDLQRLYVEAALQDIRFRLDRSGAELESEAGMPVGSTARRFHFSRPFLVYLKRRDAERPFFAIWVDNAELLSKARPQAHD